MSALILRAEDQLRDDFAFDPEDDMSGYMAWTDDLGRFFAAGGDGIVRQYGDGPEEGERLADDQLRLSPASPRLHAFLAERPMDFIPPRLRIEPLPVQPRNFGCTTLCGRVAWVLFLASACWIAIGVAVELLF